MGRGIHRYFSIGIIESSLQVMTRGIVLLRSESDAWIAHTSFYLLVTPIERPG